MEKSENNRNTEPVFECSICLETAKEPIVTKMWTYILLAMYL